MKQIKEAPFEKIAELIGVKMNKQIFARGIKYIIPFVGAAISGGFTFVTFGSMAKRLQKHLVTLPMANVDFYKKSYDNDNENKVINIDFSDIIVEDIDDLDETGE